ncbi:MAG: hypothetical protein JXQ29_06730 [Planctomycetes bacterium]|nr:hypothetical protein [Planctomycetota bacterium]
MAAPSRKRLALAFLAACAAFAPLLPAQQAATSPGIAERFPPGTIALMRYNRVEHVRAWLEKSPFAALVKDPEVSPLWNAVGDLARDFGKQAEQEAGVNVIDMLGEIRGEIAIGLTTVRIARPPAPGLLVAIDCGEGAQAVRRDLKRLLDRVPEKRYRRTTREADGSPIEVLSPVRTEGRRDLLAILGPLHVAWTGTVLVFGNDKAGLERFLQAGRAESESTLGQTENYRSTIAALGGAGDMTMYVNIQGLSALLEAGTGALPEDVGPVITALGLDQFPALGAATFLGTDAITGRFLLRYTGDRKSGLGSLLAFRKTTLAVPAWVPEDAWQVMILNYDFQGAFDGLLGMIRDAGEDPYEGFQEGLERFHQTMGLSLREDLLGALDNPVVLVRLTPVGNEPLFGSGQGGLLYASMGGQGPMLFGVRIRNRKPIEQMIEVWESMGAQVTEYLGATMISPPTFSEDQPIMEFAVTDTHVLFGLSMNAIVRRTLQRMGGREPGLANEEGVRDAVAGLPREGVGLIVYNYGKALATGLNVLKVATALSSRVETLARFPIPSASVLEKYLGHAAAVINFEPGRGVILDSSFRFKRR